MAWFPITDLSREDDIRRRRRRAAMLLACIVFIPWIAFGGGGGRTTSPPISGLAITVDKPDLDRVVSLAGAILDGAGAGSLPRPANDAAQRSIAAPALRIDLPCASSLTVLSDPAYAGRAVVYAPRDESEALGRLTMTDGLVSQTASCGDMPDLIVRTGPATPLTLVQSGDNDIRAARFDGPVTIQASGSGGVTIARTGSLNVRQQDSTDIAVGTLSGALTVSLTGSGDLRLHDGDITTLDARSVGSGDIALGAAHVQGGQLVLDGSGDFSVRQVSGTFAATSNASGDVTIGTAAGVDDLTLRGQGSGDLIVHSGKIGVLNAIRHGSGDLTVDAEVASGRVDHRGTGDVDVPNVAGLVRTGD